MAFRKRKSEDLKLDQRLGGYEAKMAPVASRASAVASIQCWQCKKPNIYDARRPPPRRCTWCRCALK